MKWRNDSTVCEGVWAFLRNGRWTVREIRGVFGVPSAIARHIQSTARTSDEAVQIAVAHQDLCNGQVGF